MHFDKMHGLGNDFVIAEASEWGVLRNCESIRRVCDRKFGIGCDTLVLYEIDENTRTLQTEFFNADGSLAEICGNASRCLGLLMNMRRNWDSFQLLANGKNYPVRFFSQEHISVNMGQASFDLSALGIVEKNCDLLNIGRNINMENADAACVSVGNPHAVIFSSVDDIISVGNILNNRDFFTNGVNVSFAKIIDKNNIDLQVFERGCGLTLACGSGASATAFLAYRKGLTARNITVHQPGGDLKISIENDESVTQTGRADYVFRGEIDL